MRRFVRHPSSIPIDLSVTRGHDAPHTTLRNISAGGLSCVVPQPLATGSPIVLRIPCIWPDYAGHGVVSWCRKAQGGYEVGIQFNARDAFKTRMVEQLCQIEQYRQQVFADQGRVLDGEQAAREWIGHHAKDFATAFPPTDESS